MARIGITALIPTAGKDVVAIFKQSDKGDDEEVLTEAHLIKASINEYATFFKHPLENGRSIVDHRIIEPTTIDLRVFLIDGVSVFGGLISGGDFITRVTDIYDQIRQLWLDGTLLSIQTRTNTYRDQVLQAMPHEETSRMFDGVALAFNTSELQQETTNEVFTPADEVDQSLVERGKQAAIDLATDAASGVLDIASGVLGV